LSALIVSAVLLSSCATSPLSAENIHTSSLVLDAHADVVIEGATGQYLGADGRSKVAIDKLKAGGVDAVVLSIAVAPGATRSPEDNAKGRALADQKLSAVNVLLADHGDDVVLAQSAQDLLDAQSRDKIAIILGLQNARSLESNVDALDEFYAQGVRVFGLNHIGHNDFSDSSRPFFYGETGEYEISEEHGGLSDLGREAVQRINELGGVLDVSQSSKAATLEIIKLSQTPIIASHSNVRTLSNVSRNLSDAEIDLIGATGGVIHTVPFGAYMVDLSDPLLLEEIRVVRVNAGLPEAYAYPYELYWEIDDSAEKVKFLMAMRAVIGPGSVERLMDHIDYIVDRIGIDHVGIGSDFNHGGGVEGFNEANEALNVTTALIERGYSGVDIEKIWGGNFLRVLRAAEAAKAE
jgi:membrane dipeptidase